MRREWWRKELREWGPVYLAAFGVGIAGKILDWSDEIEMLGFCAVLLLMIYHEQRKKP